MFPVFAHISNTFFKKWDTIRRILAGFQSVEMSTVWSSAQHLNWCYSSNPQTDSLLVIYEAQSVDWNITKWLQSLEVNDLIVVRASLVCSYILWSLTNDEPQKFWAKTSFFNMDLWKKKTFNFSEKSKIWLEIFEI